MGQAMRANPILALLQNRAASREKGIYSCCSANEFVLRAALRRAQAQGTWVLVEATANQVNQAGGYTGMTPADFRGFLDRLAREEAFPAQRLLCGGDHLGPLTWRELPEGQAMANAEELVRAYVLAGFVKIHLDTSMRLGSDDAAAPLQDVTIARRGARLCRVAEEVFAAYAQTHPAAPAPVYVVGSEVPVPGGATQNENSVAVTAPTACEATLAAFKDAFLEQGLANAWQRVIALVVQPGVEFADETVVEYNSAAAAPLVACLKNHPGLVFEGHSTDYQPKSCLKEMVQDGIAILKVGPALTFKLREGLFALEKMEQELHLLHDFALSGFRATLECAMLESNGHWAGYYHGDMAKNRYARAYSYSDRARYYLTVPAVVQAVGKLLDNLDQVGLPMALLSQYMPVQHARVQAGALPLAARELLVDHVGDCIDDYLYAILQNETP